VQKYRNPEIRKRILFNYLSGGPANKTNFHDESSEETEISSHPNWNHFRNRGDQMGPCYRPSASAGATGHSAVLGKVRVSKPPRKSQDVRIKMFKTTESKPIVAEPDFMMPSSIRQLPKPREAKPKPAKDSPLGQLRPQRVSIYGEISGAAIQSSYRLGCP
jgi:hypothetical protein